MQPCQECVWYKIESEQVNSQKQFECKDRVGVNNNYNSLYCIRVWESINSCGSNTKSHHLPD